jgi:zinc/manganese transport system substrate-binding protein
MPRKILVAAALVASLALAGCASTATATQDGRIRVTASTDAYGQIVEAIGGNAVDVTSIINRPSEDPHEFEASAQDQLDINRAQLVVQNGGGYDPFMQQLLGARPKPAAPVLTAATLAADWPGGGADATPEGFNEHVFYDLGTMKTLAARIATELGDLAPAHKSQFAANLASFTAELGALQKQQSALASQHQGTEIFVTEPLPLRLTAGAGLDNATPPAFSEAVEAGSDVPPSTLLQAQKLLASGRIHVLIANEQAGGPETTTVIAAAKQHDIPVLEWSETLPPGLTYVKWMQRNLDQLKGALG